MYNVNRESFYNSKEYKCSIKKQFIDNAKQPMIKIDFSHSCDWNIKRIEESMPMYPGVWIITDNNNYYEVASTYNIQKEAIEACKWLFLGKRDVRKNIYKSYTRQVYTRYKYQQIYKKSGPNHKIIFKVIFLEPNKEIRDNLEIDVAYITRAMYWSPSYDQSKVILNYIDNYVIENRNISKGKKIYKRKR